MNAHFAKGLAAGEARNYSEAIGHFTKAIAADPQHTESYYKRGSARLKLSDYAGAIADFDLGLKLQPNNAIILSDRGVALHLSERPEAAMADFNRALELEPKNPYRYSSRAYVRAAYGDVQGAIADYNKCLELDPDDAIALNNLGMLEEKLGYATSKDRFAQADRLSDSVPSPQADIDQMIEEWKKEKAEKEARKEQEAALPPLPAIGKNGQSAKSDRPKKLTAKLYFETLGRVLTEKETFRAFTRFVLNGFKARD